MIGERERAGRCYGISHEKRGRDFQVYGITVTGREGITTEKDIRRFSDIALSNYPYKKKLNLVPLMFFLSCTYFCCSCDINTAQLI